MDKVPLYSFLIVTSSSGMLVNLMYFYLVHGGKLLHQNAPDSCPKFFLKGCSRMAYEVFTSYGKALIYVLCPRYLPKS